jgi:hypothetical protein
LIDLAEIAARTGLHVFPCDTAKRPCVKGGFTAASKDRAEINRMFSTPGARLIGVPTGRMNKLIVIDVDVKNGARGMEWLELNREALPETRTHKTRSGGLHLLFVAPENVEIRNSASRVAPGVDVRGEGGYVIVPPSDGYAVADPIEPAEMPRWLIKACLKQEERQEQHQSNPLIAADGTPYGIKALQNACANIRNAPDGQKHDTLNREAYSIGGLVTAGEVVQSVAYAELSAALHAIRHRCEDFKGALKTLHGAFGDGMNAPRSVTHIPSRLQITPQTPESANDGDTNVPNRDKKGDKTGDTAPKALKYHTFIELEADLDASDFVEGLLIDGAMSVVYGESNAGKTFWATDLALHVAAGHPWCGREVERGAVLYLALEGAHGIKNRVAAFKRAHNMDDADLPFAVVTIGLNLLDPNADAESVVATCKAVAEQFDIPLRLIVVDTLARAMAGGNENAPEDMGALVKTGDMMRQDATAHLMYIHHSGKDTAKGARGHSSLRAATDTEIEITADGKSRQAEVRKQRDLEGGDVWRFELAPVVLGTNKRGKEVTSCVVKVITDEQTAGAESFGRHLKGHNKRALEVLTDALIEAGKTGYPGVPFGLSSVPEKWWRDRFYERAMAGAEADTKKKAFRRAADFLVENHYVGLNSSRVWVVKFQPNRENSEASDGDI